MTGSTDVEGVKALGEIDSRLVREGGVEGIGSATSNAVELHRSSGAFAETLWERSRPKLPQAQLHFLASPHESFNYRAVMC